MVDDARNVLPDRQPGTPHGDGEARRTGYGAGGLGAGGDRAHLGQDSQTANAWDAPGVAPDGRRTGSSTDGPRSRLGDEASPNPDA